METMTETPRLVATVGIHGSASTWVFNVVRELMIAALGADKVLSVYADDVPGLITEHALTGRHVVLKSHYGGVGWESLMWLSHAPILLSVRDPRDAAISLAQRFATPLMDAARGIAQDCRRLERCADAGHPVLRYEDRFFDDPAVPGQIAERLGLATGADIRQAIFDRYSTDATRAFAANIGDLPPERVLQTPHTTLDQVTQIHRTHIGDGRIGKWQDLMDPRSAAEMTRYFAPFLKRFSYAP
jgi:hypothetical protein